MASNNNTNVDNCSVCYSGSSTTSQFLNSKEIYFLLNKLFQVPVEHFPEQISESPILICGLCHQEIQHAINIYEQLIVAVNQFRNIQKRLSDCVKRRNNGGSVSKVDKSPLFSDKCRQFVIGHDYDETGPFLVEELTIKAESFLSSSSVAAETKLFGVTNDKEEEQEGGTPTQSSDDSLGEMECGEIKIENEMGSNADSTDGGQLLASDEDDPDYNGTEESESEDEDDEQVETMKTGYETKSEENDNDNKDSDDTYAAQTGFKCSKCQLSCPSQRGLAIHMSRRHKIYAASCRKFKSAKIPIDRPSKQYRYKCTEKGCDKSFQKPYVLKIHVSRHNKQPLFKCDLCDEEFYRNQSLKTHQRKFHPDQVDVQESSKSPSGESQFNCDICSKVCKTNSGLANHLKLVHNVEFPNERQCPEEGCTFMFKRADKLKDHLSKCHGRGPAHICSHCGEGFHSWKLKWRHEQKIHEGGLAKRSFMCELCGKGFTCWENLYAHKSATHQTTPAAKKKAETGKLASSSPVICALCGKALKNKASLRTHENVIHKKDKLKYACHLCEKRFLAPRYLREHLYHGHGVGPETNRRKQLDSELFQCSVTGCRQRFYGDRSKLDEHTIEIHGEDGKKPGRFCCRFCAKRYYHKWHLDHHELLHENQESRPFKCDICEKGFPTAGYLRFHKKHTHKMDSNNELSCSGGKREEMK